MRGGGIELGVLGEQPVMGCLYVAGELGLFLGVGEQETTAFVSETTCFPGVDGRIGVKYLTSAQSYHLMVEVGYELHYYGDILRGRLLSGDPVCYSVGFMGPYVGAIVRF
jgi:hypothetical protein